jgi:hypothetical protein
MRNVLVMLVLLSAPAFAAPPPSAEPRERRLHPALVEASSFLFNDWNKFQENYHPLYIGDDDATTAWVEGAKGPGVGEWVRLRVTAMQGATKVRLRLRNGYQKSEHLYKANARARTVTVVLLPSQVKLEHELADAQGWQELVVTQPSGPLEAVEIRIQSVYPGNRYEDLCLSDAQLYVTATTPDNPAYERSHFDKLLGWKKGRLEAAQLFKEASAKTLPIAPQYRVESHELGQPSHGFIPERTKRMQEALSQLIAALPPDADAARLRRWRTLLAAPASEFAPAKVVAKDKRPLPIVDGLCQPDLPSCRVDPCDAALTLPASGELAWLATDQLGVFDVKSVPSLAEIETGKPGECRDRHHAGSFAWVHRLPGSEAKARVDAILLARCGLVESREGWEPSLRVQLLGYDERGRLTLVAQDNSAAWLRWRDGDPVLAGGRQVADGAVVDVERVSEVAKR